MTEFRLKLEKEADAAYKEGNYERAYRFYAKSLVWRGDKYAQYMVGMMHEKGQGTQKNLAVANAWYRLAAERSNDQLKNAYEQNRARLSEAQATRADEIYQDLVSDMGDRAILTQLIRSDMRQLRRATGTRVGAVDSLNLRTINMRTGVEQPAHEYYRTLRKNIRNNLDLLEGTVEYGELELIDDEQAAEPDTTSAPEEK